MKTFKELEEHGGFSGFHILTHTGSANGSFVLDRANTVFRVSAPDNALGDGDKDGWLNLELEQGDRTRIYLLHSIKLTETRSFNSGVTETQIFPNICIFGAEAISADRAVTSISFRLKGAGAFFYYQMISEKALSTSVPAIDLEALKMSRMLKDQIPETFVPERVYVTHTMSEPLKFQVGATTYSMFLGASTRGPSLQAIDVDFYPILSLEFDAPTSINDAISSVYRWVGFFGQMACRRPVVEGMWVADRRVDPWGRADIYLPNEDIGDFGVHVGDIPLNGWGERDRLVQLMQSWLKRFDERKFFRQQIVAAMRQVEASLDPQVITALCAGIDSLPELGASTGRGKLPLQQMAEAAHSCLGANASSISMERISGLLGQLEKVSLSKKLTEVADAAASVISGVGLSAVVKAAMRLRQIGAHGSSGEVRWPDLELAASGLLALCINYDLTTCGLGVSGANGEPSLVAMKQLKRKVNNI